nr:C40 family peptidase [Sphingobium boeckii]
MGKQAKRRESTNTPEGFGLIGRSAALDRRIHAVRGDIADIALAGVLFAPHYARPMTRRCSVPVAAVREAPGDDAELISELLHGEAFEILDLSGAWAWGYSAHDHYVGYIRQDVLDDSPAPAWRVRVRSAEVLNAATEGASVRERLSMGALVAGTLDGDGVETAKGWIARESLQPANHVGGDPVTFAQQMIGVPYLMGGRSVDGIDCSGLVQLSLALTGVSAPRDSDLQAEALGTPRAPDAALRRGDFIFFEGHVGMMVDAERMIHANGNANAVSIDPVADVRARAAAKGVDSFMVRRA